MAVICTSLKYPAPEECISAAKGEEMVELRADLCGFSPEGTAEILRRIECPKILTCRGENGSRFLSDVLGMVSFGEVEYVDVEMETPKSRSDEIREKIHSLGGRFIVSFHDFRSTPCTDELLEIYGICVSRGADIIKIVTTAADIEDASKVMELYRRKGDDRPLVAFCMGEKGRFTRKSCLDMGAPFTYAAVGENCTVAAGQFTSAQMRRILDVSAYPYNLHRPARWDGGTLPCSKSQAQRAILAAGLSDGTSVLRGYVGCEDTEAAIYIIRGLGAQVTVDGTTLSVKGVDIRSVRCREVFTGESGLLTRMMVPLASLMTASNSGITVTGRGSLLTRDMSDVEKVMGAAGVRISRTKVPFTLRGALAGGRITVDGSSSSQCISGLLAALPLVEGDSLLTVEHPSSAPYLKMTVEVLGRFGIRIDSLTAIGADPTVFSIPGGQRYRPADFALEADWSSAAYLAVAGHIAAGGKKSREGTVPVGGFVLPPRGTGQADERVMDVLQMCGPHLKAFSFDATDCPDLFPVLAVLGCFCEGTSAIGGVRRLFAKESDRAEAILSELTALGGVVSVRDGVMYVTGSTLHGGCVSAHRDHRMALSLAVAAAFIGEDVFIDDIRCAGKSYPGFFTNLSFPTPSS